MSETLTRLGLVLAFALGLLGGCAGAGQETGAYVDDAAITTKVKTRLFNDPVTSGFAIKVTTYRGTVQLAGFVNNQREMSRAGELAGSVPGVKAVKNDLIVK